MQIICTIYVYDNKDIYINPTTCKKNVLIRKIINLKEVFACMKLLMIPVLNSFGISTDKYNIFLMLQIFE